MKPKFDLVEDIKVTEPQQPEAGPVPVANTRPATVQSKNNNKINLAWAAKFGLNITPSRSRARRPEYDNFQLNLNELTVPKKQRVFSGES